MHTANFDVQGLFQPTRPVRGVTIATKVLICNGVFQPTRPVRGVTYQKN